MRQKKKLSFYISFNFINIDTIIILDTWADNNQIISFVNDYRLLITFNWMYYISIKVEY